MRCLLLQMLFLILLAASARAAAPQPQQAAQENYYRDLKGPGTRGWYWYEPVPPREEKKEEASPEPAPPAAAPQAPPSFDPGRAPDLKEYSYQRLWEMHPDDFKKLYDAFEKRGVQTLTPEDVYATKLMRDVARRKAHAFAAVDSYVNLVHPELSTESAIPASTSGRKAQYQKRTSDIEERLKAEREDFALIYFYSESCVYCQEQSEVLSVFVRRNGWQLRGISRENNPEVFQRFGVDITPTVLAVAKNFSGSLPISYGAIALDELETRAFQAVRLVRGEIRPEQFFTDDFEKGGALDPLAGR